MQFDDSKSGDHLEKGGDKSPAVVANIRERQGVRGDGEVTRAQARRSYDIASRLAPNSQTRRLALGQRLLQGIVRLIHAGKASVRTLRSYRAERNLVRIGSFGPATSDGKEIELGATKEPVMKRTFAPLTGAAITIGWLAVVPDANAHAQYFGQYGYYHGGPSFGRSPIYAPDRPPTIHAVEIFRTGHAVKSKRFLFLYS
jgi:hypothetical protein